MSRLTSVSAGHAPIENNTKITKMSQKTSSRTNTSKFKPFTKKNGGWNIKTPKGKQLTTYCKYFYKGAQAPPIPGTTEFIEHYAYETIKEYLSKGNTLDEIKKIFVDNLERKKTQMTMMKITGLSVKELVGIEAPVFYIDFCNSVGVCLKLKAIPNDDMNGVLQFAIDEKLFNKLGHKVPDL